MEMCSNWREELTIRLGVRRLSIFVSLASFQIEIQMHVLCPFVYPNIYNFDVKILQVSFLCFCQRQVYEDEVEEISAT